MSRRLAAAGSIAGFKKTAANLCAKTKDAYSYKAYSREGWRAACLMLLLRGFTEVEAETVLRSKWMRWARDDSSARYGRATSRDLARFIDKQGDAETVLRLVWRLARI